MASKSLAKRQTNIVTFRLDAELHDLLKAAAARQKVTVTDELRTLVKEMVNPSTPGTQQKAGIPNRILEVERWFGFTVIESSQSLALFGVRNVRDLASPDKLLEGSTPSALNLFAETYEVAHDWLVTGQGSPYKSTHSDYSSHDVIDRLMSLRSKNQLRGVWLVTNHTPRSRRELTCMLVLLEKPHPNVKLGERFSVYESWPVSPLHIENADLYRLVCFCLALFSEGGVSEACPAGIMLLPTAFDDIRLGRLHPARVLNERTTLATRTLLFPLLQPIAQRGP